MKKLLLLLLLPCLVYGQVQIGEDLEGQDNGDSFAYDLSLSADGNRVAVGMLDEMGANVIDKGIVHVYENQGGSWSQIGSSIEGEAINDYFGISVALSADGNILLTGAPFNNDGGSDSGNIRVFEFQGGDWVQKGGTIKGEFASDEFGKYTSISADGNIIAVGACGFSNSKGQVRVFEFQGVNWVQIGEEIIGEELGDESATPSLSDDGHILAIGASKFDAGVINSNVGLVRVFEYDDIADTWNQLGDNIVGEGAGDNSGKFLDLSADGITLAIGAPYNDGGIDGTLLESGHVRVFEYDDSADTWVQIGEDIDGADYGDNFGQDVRLSSDGTILATAALFVDLGSNFNAGSAYVFQNEGGVWNEVDIDIGGDSSDFFGTSVCLSSDGFIMAIAAYAANANTGYARIFDLSLLLCEEGDACDDGNATTGNDVYQEDCTCLGELIDCAGEAGGSAFAGSPCDDGNVATGADIYQEDCTCLGELIDCAGEIGGSALPGSPCDDNDEQTILETYQDDCSCLGTPVGIQDLSSPNNLQLSPIPVDDQLKMTFTEKLSHTLVWEIYSVSGKAMQAGVIQTIIGENRFLLNLNDLPSGVYVLKLNNGMENSTREFVKK